MSLRPLNLRKKVWLAVGGSMVFLLGAFAWLNDAFFVRQIDRLEAAGAVIEGRRAKSLFENENDALMRSVRDYAEWTETVDFIQGREERYREKNWNTDTLKNIRVDTAGLFAPDGKLVAGIALNETRDEVRSPDLEEFAPIASVVARVMADRSAQTRELGLIVADGKLMLFACTAVLPDERTGPPLGVMYGSRAIDEAFLSRVERTLMHPVRLKISSARKANTSTEPVVVRADKDHIWVAVPLIGADAKEVGQFEIALSRAIYAQARETRWWSLGQTLITGLVVGAVISLLLGHIILRRLETLHRELARVSAEGAMDARLSLLGDDEIADLSNRMNKVLDHLSASQMKSRTLEKQLQSAQKMETIGQLAGGIAHDFNNCLTGMVGMIDLSLMSESNPVVTGYLERAKLSARHATGVVGQLLMFSQDRPPQLMRLRLDALVNESLPLLQTFVDPAVTIASSCEIVAPEVEGDATQLQQLLVNLARNAADAMQQRGRISMTVREVFLPSSLVARGAGPHAEISVRDEGPGISAEVMKRMFDPFFSTKPRGKGFGLGLTIVRRIVDHHGGQLEVSSRAGAGTTFRVYLPLRASVKPTSVVVPGASPERVLVAEDNEGVRLFAEALLRKKGYIVTAAVDGMAAFKAFEANPMAFDVILTDLSMPEMDGQELGLRALHLRPDITLILMSGFVTEQEKHLMLARGFSAVIDKPVTMAAILETLDRVKRQRLARAPATTSGSGAV